MIRRSKTIETAESILDYFNGFHDGFIKQLALISHDRFEARGMEANDERLAYVQYK